VSLFVDGADDQDGHADDTPIHTDFIVLYPIPGHKKAEEKQQQETRAFFFGKIRSDNFNARTVSAGPGSRGFVV
jgi:hypothetical protein